MVIVTPEDKKDDMLAAMGKAGVRCTVIGRIKDESFCIMKTCGGEISEVDPPYADELYKVVVK